MIVFLDILFVLICLLLIFMVVITERGEGGLAGAFGGMGSDTFFGTKAHQHISKFTMGLAVSFLVLAVLINVLVRGRQGERTPTIFQGTQQTEKAPAPEQPPAPPHDP